MNWTNGSNLTDGQHPASSITGDQQDALTAAIVVLGVWSTAGNLLTIVAIISRPGMRTKTNMFILSLALSDLLSGLIASPLWLYRRTWGFYQWNLGQLGCKIYWFVDIVTSYCTSVHIASFAMWRYIAVKFPHKMMKIKLTHVQLWMLLLWILTVVFGGIIPNSYYEAMKKPQDGGVYSHWPTCSIKFRDNGILQYKAYYTSTSAIFGVMPMFLLFIISTFIAYEIIYKRKFKSTSRNLKERRAVSQLALIAASFLFGYVPMIAYGTWTIRVNIKPKIIDYWFGVAAYICLRFSECINPIVYNISSNKMRESSKRILKIMFCCYCSSTKVSVKHGVSSQISKTKQNSSTGVI